MPGLADLHYKVVGDLAQRPLQSSVSGPEFVDMQVYGHASVSLTLANMGMLNVDVPVAIYQTGDGGFDRDVGTAFGELRATARIAWMGPVPPPEIALGTQIDVWFPTGDPDSMTGDELVKARPSATVSGKLDSFVYALNLGYIFRNHLDLGVSEIGGGPTFGAAAAILLADERVQLGTEVFGNTVTPVEGSEAPFFDAASTPLQAMVGVRVRAGDFAFALATGPGITAAPGSAVFRTVASVAFTADDRVVDRDADGLRDRSDRCPDDPGFSEDGCPPPDRDGDTIADPVDSCPDDPGLVHVDPSKHGCP